MPVSYTVDKKALLMYIFFSATTLLQKANDQVVAASMDHITQPGMKCVRQQATADQLKKLFRGNHNVNFRTCHYISYPVF